MKRNSILALLVITTLSLSVIAPSFGFTAPAEVRPYVEGQILIRFAKNTPIESAKALLDPRHFEVQNAVVPALSLYLVKLRADMTVQRAKALLSRHHEILYTQLDHYVTLREKTPNDASFAQQWSLSNPTQVDISAVRAWGLGTGGKDASGSDIVVAIVDGGVDLTHSDLKDNLWKNTAEIAGNKIDDDNNGYVDDVHGWNAFSNTSQIPANSHGTHVAGIAGARGNNSTGVTGINWDVKIMSIAASSGTTSVVAAGYGYALAQKKLWIESGGAIGANVVVTNSSFGVDYADCKSGEYPIWNDLYDSMGKAGILSAAATANLNINVDKQGDVPTGCSSEFLVNVTNTDSKDERNSSAGYGKKSIHIGAPGTNIYSLAPGNAFRNLTGTSMATPHIAGAVAFMHSVASPEFNAIYRADLARGARILKELMITNVDKIPSLQGITVSDGRLNLLKAGSAIASFKE